MPLPEILLIDKPIRMTSFDVIRVLRRKTGIKKFGHAGTLDPLASGLMIIGVESGTKKLTEYIKLDKEYEAEILLGESRSTGDMEGVVMESVEAVEVREDDIKHTLRDLEGVHTLPVSAYSAIKVDGKPMYDRARAAAKIGEMVKDVPFRDMKVYETELLDIYEREVQGVNRIIIKARFFVGSGTYIRSLGEELGRKLGYPAVLYSLRRTKIGKWGLSEARSLDSF